MSITGVYYLHTNGDMIYKSVDEIPDIRNSDFVIGLWPVDPTDRETAWNICVEGLAAGATPSRIKELASKWKCDDKDAIHYAERIGYILGIDGDTMTAKRLDFENFQESPCGFGSSYLEAMSDLAKQLGYKPSKMWEKLFKDYLSEA